MITGRASLHVIYTSRFLRHEAACPPPIKQPTSPKAAPCQYAAAHLLQNIQILPSQHHQVHALRTVLLPAV